MRKSILLIGIIGLCVLPLGDSFCATLSKYVSVELNRLARFKGRVVNSRGDPIQGVEVVIDNQDLTTNQQGYFETSQIEIVDINKSYTIEASLESEKYTSTISFPKDISPGGTHILEDVVLNIPRREEVIKRLIQELSRNYRAQNVTSFMSNFSQDDFSNYFSLEETVADFFKQGRIVSYQIGLAGLSFYQRDKANAQLNWEISMRMNSTNKILKASGRTAVKFQSYGGLLWYIVGIDDFEPFAPCSISALPDIKIEKISVGRIQLAEFDFTPVTVEIKNIGSGGAKDISVKIYDDAPSDRLLVEGEQRISILEAGSTKTVVVDLTGRPPQGRHTLRVVVDENDNIQESDESNNTSSMPITILANP